MTSSPSGTGKATTVDRGSHATTDAHTDACCDGTHDEEGLRS
jgi:hypothetical protein